MSFNSASLKPAARLARLPGDSTLAGSFNLGAAAALVCVFVWSHWSVLSGLVRSWIANQDYSVGSLVPLAAVYLVWSDRKALGRLPARTCWWGLAVLVAAQLLRLAAVLMAYGSIEQYAAILTVAGVVLLVLGAPAASRLKWLGLFLLLMVPLPRRVHGEIALPLQNLATTLAVFGLRLLGVLVSRDGNVLRVSDQTTIAVAEACSGLRMLTAFVVVAATLAFIVRRPAWQKAVLVAASVPVAVVANALRLVATVLLYEMASSEVAESFFHDFAGLTMMPMALAASAGLLWLMRWLTADDAPAPRSAPAAPAPAVSRGPALAGAGHRTPPGSGLALGAAAAFGVMLAGGGGEKWLGSILKAADAVPVALRQPLSSLPKEIGAWKGGPDIPMSERVLDVAGCDDYVMRRYLDESTGRAVDLYVAYAARPATMLSHKPDTCYPAHGWTPAGRSRERVDLPGGRGFDCLIQRFTRPQAGSAATVVLNYYILRGRYTADWTDFWGPRWRLPNLARDPNYYVVQVQVSAVLAEGAPASRAEESVRSFAAAAAPLVEALLPMTDPAAAGPPG